MPTADAILASMAGVVALLFVVALIVGPGRDDNDDDDV